MKLINFYLLLVALVFTACKKDEATTPTMTTDTTFQALVVSGNDDNDDKDGKDGKDKTYCFEFVYPVSITMPDGSALSGNEEDIWAAVKAWYEANPDSEVKPNVDYPVDINWDGDVVKTVNDEVEMEIAKKYCDDKKDYEKEDCFKLVYPVTWTMPDGTAAAMNDDLDWDTIKAWYEANADSEEKPSLNYPVSVMFKSGDTQTVADDGEMEDLKKDC
ncbi:MAG: hypothetical protein ACI8YQ_004584 [Polaribacter sp.]|jgi:hypothetical protein